MTSYIHDDGGHAHYRVLPCPGTAQLSAQMSGRAGRRGLDTVGLVFLSVGDGEAIPAELNLRTMMKGRSTLLTSQFRCDITQRNTQYATRANDSAFA